PGLVRRVPRASLAPGLTAPAPAAAPTSGSAPPGDPGGNRLPEDVRSLLSRYRSGVERGRRAEPDADALQPTIPDQERS
ncbi:MAG: hypothetical protein ACRD0M_08400, partial [Acidimicrobiales bacterium]